MKEIFIIEENEANCSNHLKKRLLNTGFQPVTIHAKPDVGLSDNLQYVKRCMSLLQTDAPGLIGIGYGGAVAGHLLAESERFRAAVLIGALTNPATAYGTGRGVISPTVGGDFRMLEYLSLPPDFLVKLLTTPPVPLAENVKPSRIIILLPVEIRKKIESSNSRTRS